MSPTEEGLGRVRQATGRGGEGSGCTPRVGPGTATMPPLAAMRLRKLAAQPGGPGHRAVIGPSLGLA